MRLPQAEDESGGVDLTPVIDIVFLLLIFFLVAARFAKQEKEVDTRLPQVVYARPLASGQRQIIINISAQGELRVEGRPYTYEQIDALLRQEKQKNPGQQVVQIRADEAVPFRFPVKVMGYCEQQDIKHSIAVEQTKAGG